jgi:hypothetical protein
MNPSFESLARIAEIEFSGIVSDSARMGEKLRLLLNDTSYIDIWLSHTLKDRFGLHWERRHLDGTFYRYDNFPDTEWHTVNTYPRHFHNGSQDVVESAPFSSDLTEGFRDFLRFVAGKMKG